MQREVVMAPEHWTVGEAIDFEAMRLECQILGLHEVSAKAVVFPLPKMHQGHFPVGDFTDALACVI